MPYNFSYLPEDDGSNNQQGSTNPTFAERLGLVAAVVTVIGDVLGLVATQLAIEERIQDTIQDEKDKAEQDQIIKKMQNQIDTLQNEIKLMKENSNK